MSYLILQADAGAIPLPSNYVHTVITSPPYWGLRDYGHASQIGLEATPDLYVASICAVFDEVWRVLRGDGTCWLNLGDCYARTGGTDVNPSASAQVGNTKRTKEIRGDRTQVTPVGLKSKDLVGIPWMVAFALRAKGWYLRSDIIWNKPNPMPESVRDRPTRSHEYLFLLTKAERYYYDSYAIRESSQDRKPWAPRSGKQGQTGMQQTSASERRYTGFNERYTARLEAGTVATGRNRRSVWTIPPKPYKGAHFATFPPELVDPCVLAGSSPQCCAACGAPFLRLVEKGAPQRDQQIACGSDAEGAYAGVAQKDYAAGGAQDPSAVKARILAGMVETRTIGWRPSCTCEEGWAPSIVFDPFGGSGTVAQVAHQHGRVGIVQDRKLEYCQLALQRCLGRRREA